MKETYFVCDARALSRMFKRDGTYVFKSRKIIIFSITIRELEKIGDLDLIYYLYNNPDQWEYAEYLSDMTTWLPTWTPKEDLEELAAAIAISKNREPNRIIFYTGSYYTFLQSFSYFDRNSTVFYVPE